MQTFLNKLFKFPLLNLILILVVTFIFMRTMKSNARMETDLDKYMPQNHPAFIFSDEAEKMFNIKDGIIIAIENPEGIYNHNTLSKHFKQN